MGPAPHRTFHWKHCAEEMAALVGTGLELERERRWFESETLRVHPPLAFPIPPDCWTVRDYVRSLPPEPSRHAVIVMQAGAVSLGRFAAGEEVATRTLKRYVVRGHGKAQQTHLDAKGKSKYGSRLRLQNAKRLFEDANAKLLEWEGEHGPADLVYYSGTARLWADLFTVRPAPPFERDVEPIRIPLDLGRPTTDVLRRAYRSLCWGRIEERGDGA